MKKIIKHWPFVLGCFLLAGLLWRSPFSTRTLIPNIEPYPDSFYYLSPGYCLLRGKGFHLCLENNLGVKSTVPPVYSALMIPFFIIKQDPRMFYFLNVILSFTNLALIYLIARKITSNRFIIGLSLLIFGSTYFIYWLPTIPMAENLLLPAFLLSFYLWLLPISRARLIMAAIAISFIYGSKYAGIGSTFGLTVLFLIKIFNSYYLSNTKMFWLNNGLFLFIVLSFYLLFGGMNTFNKVFGFIDSTFFQPPIDPESIDKIKSLESSVWYASTNHMISNLKFYANFFIGKPVRILWDNRSILAPIISWTATLGLLTGVFIKKTRVVSLALIWLVIIHLIPILPFYVSDGRYAIIIFPVLIIGLIMGLTNIKHVLQEKFMLRPIIFNTIIILLAGFYLFSKASILRHQLAVNLKYQETPWWYLATLEMNNYFDNQTFSKEPYLITLISPFYFDYFGNGKYQPLPMVKSQDFEASRQEVYGFSPYLHLLKVYENKLEEGESLFITNYGTSALPTYENQFLTILDSFDHTLIQEGCHSQCNLYQLKL